MLREIWNRVCYSKQRNERKIEKTNLEKYGVKIASCNKEIANKIRTKLTTKSEEERKIIQEKIRQTNLEKYGVEYFCLTDKARNGLTCISKPNKNFRQC